MNLDILGRNIVSKSSEGSTSI